MTGTLLTTRFFPHLDTSRLPDGYLDEVLAFAARRGLTDQLMGCFERLDQAHSRLFTDYAPHSFLFEEFLDKPPTIHGGLIYYGPGDSGVGAPQFSVRIGDTSEGWSIHT